ncbi:MAG: hypothetical protein WC595_02995 [Candidatus Nanoarchaeia archaeon]
MNITFSSDGDTLALEDVKKASALCEAYFSTEKDVTQIPTSTLNSQWIYDHIKEYLNIIRLDGIMIGYTFMLPSTLSLMKDFITHNITEATLFEQLKYLDLTQPPEAIYLSDTVLLPAYRGNGFATTAFVKTLTAITAASPIKPVLFYWKHSPEGERLAQRIVQETGLVLHVKTDA